jgi:hypothetical protein
MTSSHPLDWLHGNIVCHLKIADDVLAEVMPPRTTIADAALVDPWLQRLLRTRQVLRTTLVEVESQLRSRRELGLSRKAIVEDYVVRA